MLMKTDIKCCGINRFIGISGRMAVATLFSLLCTSCLHKDCLFGESVPPMGMEQYLMTVANDSDVATVWYFPSHGNVSCEDAGQLPSSKPACSAESDVCFPLQPRKSLMITISYDGVTHPAQGYHVDDSLPIYVFDKTVFETSTWEQIVNGQLWLKKFTFTVEQLVEADRKVRYTVEAD